MKILESSKLKEFADLSFKFDENGSSSRFEKTVEKEKLRSISNFSFFHSVFKRLVLQTCKTRACLGKGYLLTRQSQVLMTLKKRTLETLLEKDNAGVILFPQCFLPFLKQVSNFQPPFIFSSANAFILDQSKILSFGKESVCLCDNIVPSKSLRDRIGKCWQGLYHII